VSVRAERSPHNVVIVPHRRTNWQTGPSVPDSSGLVATCGDNSSHIITKARMLYAVGMLHRCSNRRACYCIPDLGSFVTTSRYDQIAVRAQAGRIDGRAMPYYCRKLELAAWLQPESGDLWMSASSQECETRCFGCSYSACKIKMSVGWLLSCEIGALEYQVLN